MVATPKKVSEEELEKQYADYRAQFEQWKENNKSSIGTEAYNSYVNQFEQWERDVEARKAQQIKHRKTAADKEAEAAAAYAQSQEAYMKHHVKAMEQAEMQQRAAAVAAAAAAAAQQQQHMMQTMMFQRPGEHLPPGPHAPQDLMVRELFQGSVQQIPGVPPGTQPPPQLWGNIKPVFDARDPLFAKWGDRAAPAHYKPDTEGQNPIACWLLLDALREKKMVLAPHSSNCPPPPVQVIPPQ